MKGCLGHYTNPKVTGTPSDNVFLKMNKPGVAQVGAPLNKIQKEHSVLHMRRDTSVKGLSKILLQILPEGIPMQFENRFFPNSKHQNTQCRILPKNPKGRPFKFEKRFFQVQSFSKSEGVHFGPIKIFFRKSHTVPKNIGLSDSLHIK